MFPKCTEIYSPHTLSAAQNESAKENENSPK